MKKICVISTRPLSIQTFFLDNLMFLADNNFSVFIISDYDEAFSKKLTSLDERIVYIPVEMKRGNISPFALFRYISRFRKIFREHKFDLIQYVSSNASLYASIAGKKEKVPHRIYCEWGYTYLGYSGIKKVLYKFADKLICKNSTIIQTDSFSNRDFGIKEKLFDVKKWQIIWNGSACGIDFEKLNYNEKEEWNNEVRNRYGIPKDSFVFGFVGRIEKDKGINELFSAFKSIVDDNVFLLLVGPVDSYKKIDKELLAWASKCPNIIWTGLVDETKKYYSSMDFLVLPSYREGFGLVILEAAAMKVPSIVTNISGPIDFVKDGENGFLCEVRSSISLLSSMQKAISLKENDYNQLCEKAYTDAITKYDRRIFKQYFLENKKDILKE